MTKPGRKSAAELAIVPPVEPPKRATPPTMPDPPAHLSKEAAAWWRDVLRDYDLNRTTFGCSRPQARHGTACSKPARRSPIMAG